MDYGDPHGCVPPERPHDRARISAGSESAPSRRPPASLAAGALGTELARSVVARARAGGASAEGLAGPLRLDPQRVRSELAYLSIFTMHFCIDTAIADPAARRRVVGAFYDALWAEAPWGASADGVDRRMPTYGDALGNPHPEFGRSYRVGRAFARGCNARHDVAVIELGARVFVSQLEPILACLRGIVVC